MPRQVPFWGKRFLDLYDYYHLPGDKRAEYISLAQNRATATHRRWIQALIDLDALRNPLRDIQTNWIVAGSLAAAGLIWGGILRKRRRLAELGVICLGLAAVVTFWYPAFVAHRSLTWMDRLPLGIAAVATVWTGVRNGVRSKWPWLGGMGLAGVAGCCCEGLVLWGWVVDGVALTVVIWAAIVLVMVKGWRNRLLASAAFLGGVFGFAFPDYPLFAMRRAGLFTLPYPQGLFEWLYPISAGVLGASCLVLLLVNVRIQSRPLAQE